MFALHRHGYAGPFQSPEGVQWHKDPERGLRHRLRRHGDALGRQPVLVPVEPLLQLSLLVQLPLPRRLPVPRLALARPSAGTGREKIEN